MCNNLRVGSYDNIIVNYKSKMTTTVKKVHGDLQGLQYNNVVKLVAKLQCDSVYNLLFSFPRS